MVKTVDPTNQPVEVLQERKAVLLKQMLIPSDFLRASYVKQFLTCGKTNCRCQRGFKHGPFYYLVQCLRGGKVRKFLLKTPERRRRARAGIAAYEKLQQKLAELSEINTELLRQGERF
ncbi:MAG TPA: DUF6788 family protein [Verrucomicrobiae bacterium]|nr:DUF6788 family protein [Verrucomicrobiae bacterium]HEV2436928.1 DUF6788 family protein [Verrucomicrobiae bacterium]